MAFVTAVYVFVFLACMDDIEIKCLLTTGILLAACCVTPAAASVVCASVSAAPTTKGFNKDNAKLGRPKISLMSWPNTFPVVPPTLFRFVAMTSPGPRLFGP